MTRRVKAVMVARERVRLWNTIFSEPLREQSIVAIASYDKSIFTASFCVRLTIATTLCHAHPVCNVPARLLHSCRYCEINTDTHNADSTSSEEGYTQRKKRPNCACVVTTHSQALRTSRDGLSVGVS